MRDPAFPKFVRRYVISALLSRRELPVRLWHRVPGGTGTAAPDSGVTFHRDSVDADGNRVDGTYSRS